MANQPPTSTCYFNVSSVIALGLGLCLRAGVIPFFHALKLGSIVDVEDVDVVCFFDIWDGWLASLLLAT